MAELGCPVASQKEAPQAIPCHKCGHPSAITIPDRDKQRKGLARGKKYWYAYYYKCPACSHQTNPLFAQRRPDEFPLEVENVASIPLTKRDPPAREERLRPPPGVSWRDWYQKTYLKDSNWRKRRSEAIGRARATCQVCGKAMSTGIHVHHNNYDSLGHESAEDVIVLCARCHAGRHGMIE